MKLAIIFNKNKFSGKLTKFWTGCYAYHVGWVDEENGKFYDMHWIRRRREWPIYGAETKVVQYDFPNVTREYLEHKLETDKVWYGVADYALFALRPILHLFGYSTINAGGVICSEMINIDLRACGYDTPYKIYDAPPSPCDLSRWLESRGKENK